MSSILPIAKGSMRPLKWGRTGHNWTPLETCTLVFSAAVVPCLATLDTELAYGDCGKQKTLPLLHSSREGFCSRRVPFAGTLSFPTGPAPHTLICLHIEALSKCRSPTGSLACGDPAGLHSHQIG